MLCYVMLCCTVSYIVLKKKIKKIKKYMQSIQSPGKKKGTPGFEPGPIGLQPIALPLSYTPRTLNGFSFEYKIY